MRNHLYLQAIEITNKLLNDILFMCEMRTKSTYFTRGGKMGFKDLILFSMNFIRKSLQIELNDFFQQIKEADETLTKQSYSEARQKISPKAFIKMTDAVTTWFYSTDEFKKFRNYRLSAIDGSVIELNNSKRLREAFGYVENKTVKMARAMASGLYDLENNLIIASKIASYRTGERDIAVELIEKLKSLGLKNDLILLDRGYRSGKFAKYLEDSGIKYVMRVSNSNFISAINKCDKPDQIIKIKVDKKEIKIRVLRFMLESGEEEKLITNLLDSDFSLNDFKSLYFKRWGIETKYQELKCKLQLENFTGDSQIAVEQDFYASIYLSNMAALAKNDANQKVKDKQRKYDYKVNTNILIGSLKDSLVKALLEDNPRKRQRMVNKVLFQISKNIIPVRPGRKFPRNMQLSANKYQQQQKRCL